MFALSAKSILFEDNHLLIVNKPAGILSQLDKTEDLSILEYAKTYIKEKYDKPGNVFIGLPHRLDRPVSGVLILCKTSKALTRMNQIFEKRAVEKIYHAVIRKTEASPVGLLRSFIKKDTRKNKAIISHQPFSGAKEAISHYSIKSILEPYTLIELNLETGRPHQIRAQLSFHLNPIIGDLRYGEKKPLSDRSIALHCYSVSFIHPVKKEPLRVTAKYPSLKIWQQFK